MAATGRLANQDERSILFVGTTEGVFVYDSDFEREKWKRTAHYLPAFPVHSIAYDYRDQNTVYVATGGDGLHITQDFGRTWRKAAGKLSTAQVTDVEIGHVTKPDSIWLGLQPANVAHSEDAGATFTEVEGFRAHASAEEWWAPDGEPYVHSIIVEPSSPDVLYVAASVAGVFCTEDGGKTWEACNEGVPPSYPDKHEHEDVHREVFGVVANPAAPDRLFAIGKTGVFRSDDDGLKWDDISDGLPTRAVRAIAMSPLKPGTLYLIPLDHDHEPPTVDGKLTVCRTIDGGDTWEQLASGLPDGLAATMYREAMCLDTLDDEGLYFGTSKGSIFVSKDGGESWLQLASGLPPITSLEIITEEQKD